MQRTIKKNQNCLEILITSTLPSAIPSIPFSEETKSRWQFFTSIFCSFSWWLVVFWQSKSKQGRYCLWKLNSLHIQHRQDQTKIKVNIVFTIRIGQFLSECRWWKLCMSSLCQWWVWSHAEIYRDGCEDDLAKLAGTCVSSPWRHYFCGAMTAAFSRELAQKAVGCVGICSYCVHVHQVLGPSGGRNANVYLFPNDLTCGHWYLWFCQLLQFKM